MYKGYPEYSGAGNSGNSGGSKDMDFNGVTEGFSKEGYGYYISYLKLNIVDTICDMLDKTDGIINALNKGWQGNSRDKFIEKFNKTKNKTEDEIIAEFKSLKSKLSILAYNYYEQDAKMLSDMD